jgi:hypothetical protein
MHYDFTAIPDADVPEAAEPIFTQGQIMPTNAAEIRAAVEWRFTQVARSPEQEEKFPIGPASAKKLGYDRRKSIPYRLR